LNIIKLYFLIFGILYYCIFCSFFFIKTFFITVIIDQSNEGLSTKYGQYLTWLKSIPVEKLSDKGEIKGSNLSDEELLSFVNSVYNESPNSSHSVVCFNPAQNPPEVMLNFKEQEVQRIKVNIQLATKDGKKELAEQYHRMSIWYKNAKKMHYQHYFKMLLLNKIITRSFEKAIGLSILYEMRHDKTCYNLQHLHIKIDEDFIRGADPNIYWKEVLRNTFIREINATGIPTLAAWPDTHPFLQKYKHDNKEELNFKDLFSNHCEFLESHNSFEIQMADIIGIIYNRYFNRNRCFAAYKELFAKKRKLEKPLSIILNKTVVR